MGRILIVTWNGGGNVPPALGIGAELTRRGHRVRVLGHAQQRDTIASAGLDFTAYSRDWDPLVRRAATRAAFAYLGLFSDPGPGVEVRAELARHPADLVVVDAMSLGALRGALRAGVRTAVLVHTFHSYLIRSWASGPVGLAATLRGLRPGPLWNAADRVLVATDRELDPTGPLPPNVRHTGAVQPAPRPVARDAEPFVLVSLSTIFYERQAQALELSLRALRDLGISAVVATGAVDPASLSAHAGVRLHRHVSHADLMPRASLLIGHGGHATTMYALAHDLPVLVLPLDPYLDQGMIGAQVAAAGAGRVLSPSAAPEEIRDAVHTLLADGPHRTAAATIGARIRATDGARRAVDEIEAVLSPVEAGRASDQP